MLEQWLEDNYRGLVDGGMNIDQLIVELEKNDASQILVDYVRSLDESPVNRKTAKHVEKTVTAVKAETR